MSDTEKFNKLANLISVFTPSAPIEVKTFFAGRETQISKTVDTIFETGKHAVLYGERGVGKTSLANIIPAFINAIQSNLNNQSEDNHITSNFITPVKITCNRDDSFGSCWKKAFGSITLRTSKESIGFLPEQKAGEETVNLDQILLPQSQEDVTPNDVISALSKLQASNFLFVFDEFDAIKNEKVRRNFADTIKSLSDNIKSATILLVGIGDSVSSLIGEHPSIERCITQIGLQRMSNEELGNIID
ncbi:MAG: ATP-binding protein, partial [Leptolyngbya sp. SIO4C1]|nr:ATP-binding protein [Leptolyngbya sp. SIO4C1]